MNPLTELMTNSMVPEMAVIIYRNNHDYYLERRDIEKGEMKEGIPLTEKCLSGISEVLTSDSDKIIHGTIPSIMFYADSRSGNEKYIWHRKPEIRRLYFSSKLNIPSGEMKLPGLVYMVKGKNLSVFAVKNKNKIGINTKLYRSPFFNVDFNAKVCLGNAKLKKPGDLTYQSIIRYWEDKFWLSEFDHLLGGNPVKCNLSTLTKNCIKSKCDFPVNVLHPLKIRLKDLLK